MQKLELTWIGKEKQPHVEPRILLHDPSKDYGDPDSQNMLIHGDNLLALKALEQKFAGGVKCIYIDPPYNSGNAFENYDDNLEHSTWLNLMRPRLEILHNLLSESGSIWISIDDDEGHYLKAEDSEACHATHESLPADVAEEPSHVHVFHLHQGKAADGSTSCWTTPGRRWLWWTSTRAGWTAPA